MIKIPNRPSSKTDKSSPFFVKPFPSRISVYFLSLFILYILLPIYLTIVRPQFISPKSLFIFYLINAIIVACLVHKILNKRYQLERRIQNLQEKINILKDEFATQISQHDAIFTKIARYNRLKEIIEKLNEDMSLDSIANELSTIVFSLLAENRGSCILYLVDPATQHLSLFKAKKEDPALIIKSKEGDIFDLWVLKHTSPLLITDIKDDFRFDLEKISSQEGRHISSLISAPLISENKFVGILRLDNTKADFYSLDELRLLVTICDLGAVALENGELFQKTQELAIHDGLTSLYTKGYFLERLKEEHKRCTRQNAQFSLLMLDIDHFKNYNDKFGHTAGDTVLRTLSAVIVDYLKSLGPVVSRFGGEEFCIILPMTDKKKAHINAEGLRRKIEQTSIVLRQRQANVTVSIGVATFPADAGDEDEIIIKADKAMYEAKQRGRNRVVDA